MPDCSSWAAWITLSLLTTVSPMTYHRNSQPSHVTSQRGEPQATPHHITNLTFLPAQNEQDEDLLEQFPFLEENDIMWNVVNYGPDLKVLGLLPQPLCSVFSKQNLAHFIARRPLIFGFIAYGQLIIDFPPATLENIWDKLLAPRSHACN